jgi:hypothetical protein
MDAKAASEELLVYCVWIQHFTGKHCRKCINSLVGNPLNIAYDPGEISYRQTADAALTHGHDALKGKRVGAVVCNRRSAAAVAAAVYVA